MNSGSFSIRLEFTPLITETVRVKFALRAWKAATLLAAAVFLVGFAPAFANSQVTVNPTTVPVGGTVTITLTKTSGVGPDIFASLTVTDPLGNVFSYTGTPLSVSSSKSFTFPSPSWTMISGPGGNPTGTSVSGMYTVTGQYANVVGYLRMHFKVTTATFTAVPEFNASILLLVGMMIPAMMLVRSRTSSKALA